MHKIADEHLPCVMHAAAGPTLAPTMSIFGDQTDVMAVRQTGFCLLSSHTVQECHDLALVAHLAAVATKTPFVHFFDGLRTSHESNKVQLLPYATLKLLRTRAATLAQQVAAQKNAQQDASDEQTLTTADVVDQLMHELTPSLGKRYGLFEYCGDANAESVLVVMDAGASVVEATLADLKIQKVGVLKVHLYRPWSPKHFLAALPKTVKRIAVLERAVETTSEQGPLRSDVTMSFHSQFWDSSSAIPAITSCTFGLGAQELHPGMVAQLYAELAKLSPAPGQIMSVPTAAKSALDLGVLNDVPQYIFWGLGADGCGSSVRRVMNYAAQQDGSFPQCYFLHDTHTSGLVSCAHMRIGSGTTNGGGPIHTACLVQSADVIVIFNPSLFLDQTYDILGRLKHGGSLLINTAWTAADFELRLPASLKAQIAKHGVRIVVVDATRISNHLGLRSRIDLIMEAAFHRLTANLSEDTSASASASLNTPPAPPSPAGSAAPGEKAFQRSVATIVAVQRKHTFSQQLHTGLRSINSGVSNLSSMTPTPSEYDGSSPASSIATPTSTSSFFSAAGTSPDSEAVAAACSALTHVAYPQQAWLNAFHTHDGVASVDFPDSLPHLLMPMTVQTPYLDVLSELFGDSLQVLNENGHLFEDNAEFGYGVAVAQKQIRDRLASNLETILSLDDLGGAPVALLQEWVNNREDVAKSTEIVKLLQASQERGGLSHPALSRLCENLKGGQLVKRSQWVVGGDGWSYDVSYGGVEQVLSSGLDLNILLVHTSPIDANAEKPTLASDIAVYAMHHSPGFIASVALDSGFDDQLHTALKQAEEFPGPSLVVAYCPEGDGSETVENAKVVEDGKWPLYRWDPSFIEAKDAHSAAPEVGEGEGSISGASGEEEKEGDEDGAEEDKDKDKEKSRGHLWVDTHNMQERLKALLNIDTQHTIVVDTSEAAAAAGVSFGANSIEEKRSAKIDEMAKQKKLSEDALTSTFNKLFESVTGQSAGVGGSTAAAEPPKVTILFGSDGGNAEAVAKRFASEAKEHKIPAKALPGNDFDLSKLASEEVVIAVVSTAGQGEFPGNMHSFWDGLNALEKSTSDLSKVKFAVCGLGDRNYWPRPEDKHLFCKAGKDLDTKFESLGAQRLLPMGVGDDQDDDGYETGVDAFSPQLWAAINALSAGGGGGAAPVKVAKKKKMTVEDIKIASNYLRGTIAEGLADESTGAIAASDTQLTKFHGIYQQDDRDLRLQLQKEKKEKAYSFLIRIGPPGGVVTCKQWMVMQDLADTYGFKPLKITTRQAVQYHGVLKKVLKKTMQGINKALLTSLAACGDVNRNVMCNPNPLQSKHHAAAQKLAVDLTKNLLPRTTAYHEIWLDKKPVVGYKDVEPLYGPTYLPRKFKIAIAIPPSNDVDVFAHCLGFIAVIDKQSDTLVGWNVSVGGGMGMTHNKKKTFPRLADIMGFVTPAQTIDVARAVIMVQRDHGDRTDRKHARLKYTIDDHGLGWFKEKVEGHLGWKIPPAREYAEPFNTNTDRYGWCKGLQDTWHYGLFVENGRVKDGYDNNPDIRMRTGLYELAKVHKGDFRLTPNQHIIIGNVSAADRPAVDQLLKKYGLDNRQSGMRASSMACTALPTCCHALAESERYLPELISSLDTVLDENGLRDDEIVIRMTGCPNGCARPYLGEIGFVGRAPGIYNVYLGAKHTGERLNKLWQESLNNEQIIGALSPLIKQFAETREEGEHFGDFVVRIGVIKGQTSNPKISLDEGLKRPEGVTFHEHTPIWDW